MFDQSDDDWERQESPIASPGPFDEKDIFAQLATGDGMDLDEPPQSPPKPVAHHSFGEREVVTPPAVPPVLFPVELRGLQLQQW